MGYIEIFSMDENGAGWKDLSELTADERVSLEVDVDLALLGLNGEIGLLCFTCLKPIPSGMGHSFCEQHKPK